MGKGAKVQGFGGAEQSQLSCADRARQEDQSDGSPLLFTMVLRQGHGIITEDAETLSYPAIRPRDLSRSSLVPDQASGVLERKGIRKDERAEKN